MAYPVLINYRLTRLRGVRPRSASPRISSNILGNTSGRTIASIRDDRDDALGTGPGRPPDHSFGTLRNVEAIDSDVPFVIEQEMLRRDCRAARVADAIGLVDPDLHRLVATGAQV